MGDFNRYWLLNLVAKQCYSTFVENKKANGGLLMAN